MLLFCIFPVEFDYEHCSYCYMLLFSYRLLKYWKMDIVKNLVFANFNIIVSYIFNRKKIIWNCILRLNEMGICAILFPFRRLYKLCNLSVCFIFFFDKGVAEEYLWSCVYINTWNKYVRNLYIFLMTRKLYYQNNSVQQLHLHPFTANCLALKCKILCVYLEFFVSLMSL